jgi:RNA polymerase sigma-70 factor (ECF subfamily)
VSLVGAHASPPGARPFFNVYMREGSYFETELIERLKRREPDGMADLYDKYKGLVYSIIYHVVRGRGIAEDLTQETFWRVWNRIHTFDAERGRLEHWMATIARNRAVDYLRSARNAPLLSVESIELNTTYFATQSHEARIESENRVLKALKSLNPAQREVIELVHYQGLTQTEIAEALQRPLGTIKSIVRSALKVLRGALEEAQEGAAHV